MIEQKLDRIIELLEIIADGVPKKRKTRADAYRSIGVTEAQLKTLKGRMTFHEVCEKLHVIPSRSSMVLLGKMLTDAGVLQSRTKHQRYYHFD